MLVDDQALRGWKQTGGQDGAAQASTQGNSSFCCLDGSGHIRFFKLSRDVCTELVCLNDVMFMCFYFVSGDESGDVKCGVDV